MTDLWFHGLPKLKAPPRFVVGHWVGAESKADRVYRTLVQRGLSVHYVNEADGTLVQMAHHTDRCAHAGSRGNVGIGVENVSPGFPKLDKKASRSVVDGHAHGRPFKACAFTDAQLASYVALCERLAAEFGWPRQVPNTDRVLTNAELARFSGAVEHLHLTMRKVDSGMLLTKALIAAGWAAVDP